MYFSVDRVKNMLLARRSMRGGQGDPGSIGLLHFWALRAVTQEGSCLAAWCQVGPKFHLRCCAVDGVTRQPAAMGKGQSAA